MFEWLTGLDNGVLSDLYTRVKLSLKAVIQDVIDIRKFLYKHFNLNQQRNIDRLGELGELEPNKIIAMNESSGNFKQVDADVVIIEKLSEYSFRDSEGAINVGEENMSGVVYIPFTMPYHVDNGKTYLNWMVGNHSFQNGTYGGFGKFPSHPDATQSLKTGHCIHDVYANGSATFKEQSYDAETLYVFDYSQLSYLAKYGNFWSDNYNNGDYRASWSWMTLYQRNVAVITNRIVSTDIAGNPTYGMGNIAITFANSLIVLLGTSDELGTSNLDTVKNCLINLWEGSYNANGQPDFSNKVLVWENLEVLDLCGHIDFSGTTAHIDIPITPPKRNTPYRVVISTKGDLAETYALGYFIDRRDMNVTGFTNLENKNIPPSEAPVPQDPTEFYDATKIVQNNEADPYLVVESIVDPQTYFTAQSPQTANWKITTRVNALNVFDGTYYSAPNIFDKMSLDEWLETSLSEANIQFSIASFFQTGRSIFSDLEDITINVSDISVRFRDRSATATTQEPQVGISYSTCMLECFVYVEELERLFYVQFEDFMNLGYFLTGDVNTAWAYYLSGEGHTDAQREATWNASIVSGKYDATLIYANDMLSKIDGTLDTGNYFYLENYSNFTTKIIW